MPLSGTPALHSTIATAWALPRFGAEPDKLALLVLQGGRNLEVRPSPLGTHCRLRLFTACGGAQWPFWCRQRSHLSLELEQGRAGWSWTRNPSRVPTARFVMAFFFFIMFDILKAEPHYRQAISSTRLGKWVLWDGEHMKKEKKSDHKIKMRFEAHFCPLM